jgi:aromatic ring hydroxylase
MNTQSIEQSISEYIKTLNIDEQIKILEFVRNLSLSKTKGSFGKDLISFAASIDSEDLSLMKKAIDSDCEKVNDNEW